ncbi:MAG: outer membrane lipoprotein-sorting protein [bacterium]|nr:outer membrane lipoprotein-sorting protein [bacterium]
MKKVLFATLLLFATGSSFAQTDTLEMILDTYFENIGGREALSAVEGYKMTAEMDFQGMTIPIDQYTMKDGRSMTSVSVMGMDMKQDVFDGETLWGTSQMTMQPEKADAETTENKKRSIGDFPDPFLNMEENGFSAEYVGIETADGTECFKVKLTMKPQLVDGEEKDNIMYYYFDTENFVPLVAKQEVMEGPAAGQMMLTTYSDYQEVDGIYFPFSLKFSGESGEGQTLVIKEIELNPELEEGFFAFPDVEEEEEEEGEE